MSVKTGEQRGRWFTTDETESLHKGAFKKRIKADTEISGATKQKVLSQNYP